MLLLLNVPLLHLLSLLLMPLLHLLLLGLVGVLTLHFLMFLVLFLLEFLPLLFLLREHFALLLLVFPVTVTVPGVGRSGTFKRGKVLGMGGRPRVVFAARYRLSRIGRRMIGRSSFFG